MSKLRRRKKAKIRRLTAGFIMGISIIGITSAAISLSDARADDLDQTVAIFEPVPVNQGSSGQQDGVTKAITITDAHILEESPIIAKDYPDVTFVPLPVPMSEQDQQTVFEICLDGGVSFPLVMAMIEHESQFDGSARSDTGDSGYMQINDCNADSLADLGYTDLFDLYQNVSAGVYMLKDLFNKYDGDTVFVLMAYNAGETGAANQRAAGIYETEYTVEILERAEAFSSYIDNALNE